MRSMIPGRLILLAVAACVVALLSLPDLDFAHSDQPPVAEQLAHDTHSDESHSTGIGHCHGEASCSSGLHIVFGLRTIPPERPPLPALDRVPTNFNDATLGREPPVPIALS